MFVRDNASNQVLFNLATLSLNFVQINIIKISQEMFVEYPKARDFFVMVVV